MSRDFDLGTYLCVIIFKCAVKYSDVLSMELNNNICKQ